MEIIKVVLELWIFFSIVVSVAEAVVINRNGIKMLLANGFSTFVNNDNPVFSNRPRSDELWITCKNVTKLWDLATNE